MLNVPAGNVKRMACDELQMYALLRTEMWANSATQTLPLSSLYRARYRGRTVLAEYTERVITGLNLDNSTVNFHFIVYTTLIMNAKF